MVGKIFTQRINSITMDDKKIIPPSITVTDHESLSKIVLWDAEAYGDTNSIPVFGLKLTSPDDDEFEVFIDKKDIESIVQFLKSIKPCQ